MRDPILGLSPLALPSAVATDESELSEMSAFECGSSEEKLHEQRVNLCRGALFADRDEPGVRAGVRLSGRLEEEPCGSGAGAKRGEGDGVPEDVSASCS